ncbi:hypothetical protein B0I68_002872 [Clostridium beijerinckii]|nr:hypothetical protein [Clostridium beijerinckii]
MENNNNQMSNNDQMNNDDQLQIAIQGVKKQFKEKEKMNCFMITLLVKRQQMKRKK